MLFMATVDSTSSRSEVQAAMADNASYSEDNSVAKARAYVTACNVWLVMYAFDESQQGNSGTRMRMDSLNRSIRAGMEKAERWIANQPASSPATSYAGYSKVDLSGGRE